MSDTALPVPRKKPLSRRDQEFLPAAIEILETPPSPVRLAFLTIICVFVAVTVVWSYLGRIDIIATAQGKLQPTGRVKVIQPLETSRVLRARVENGMHVKAGEILVELDPSDAASDAAAFAADLASYSAEVIRREVSMATAKAGQIELTPTIQWPGSIPKGIRTREDGVLSADLLQLSSQVASLEAQAQQKKTERQRLAKTIDAQNDLIQTLQERVNMRSLLVDRQAGSKSNLIDATETLQYQKTVLAQQVGQRDEADANLSVISKDIRKAFQTFIADNAQKHAEAERQAGDLEEKLAKATSRLEHMTLASPIDGVIQASALTTVGQVVTSGEELLRIVPDDAALEIECYLPNKDIAFVREGQEAIIKIESFPFTRYGTVKATVVRVGRDAIPEPDADQQETNPSHPSRSTLQAGGQRVQNLVFPVTLRPATKDIDVDGTRIPLGAGMALTAEIRTGSRRMLEYVFSPLAQMSSEAMRER